MLSENQSDADNQQERSHANGKSSETTRQSPLIDREVIKAYLFGAMHDGMIRYRDQRYRIAQKDRSWLEAIQTILHNIGYRSWIYKEGKTRNVYVLESVAPIFREGFNPYEVTNTEERIAYIRGFFDAEGGTPRNPRDKRYIQLVQKDYKKIALLASWLNELSIMTGKIHNPSKNVDPDYWRVFIRMPSINNFVCRIGSWHPRKDAIFQQWMKI